MSRRSVFGSLRVSSIIVVRVYTGRMKSTSSTEWCQIIITVPGSPADDDSLWADGKFSVAGFLGEVFGTMEISEPSSRLRTFAGRYSIGVDNQEFVMATGRVSHELQKANVPYWMYLHTWEQENSESYMSVYWSPGMPSGSAYLQGWFKEQNVDWSEVVGAAVESIPPLFETIERELTHGYVKAVQANHYSELEAILGG